MHHLKETPVADDSTLVINADASPLVAALGQAQAATARATEQMAGSFGQLTNAIGGVGKAFGVLTAVLAGGAAFKSAISATLEWEGGALKLAKALGVTTEQASVYQTALQHIGVDGQVMVDATAKMSKAIGSNEEAFQKLGIATRDSGGHFRAAGDVLQDTLARLREIKSPIDQNIVGMQLFGKGWAEIRPLLKLTGDAMREAEQRAKDLGLIVGPDGAAQARAYKESMNDVQLVAKSFQVQIGNALIPTLTQLGAAFSSEGPAMAQTFARALTGAAVVVETLWNSFQKLSKGVGAYVAAYAMLLKGDKEGAKSVWAEYGKDVDDLNQKLTDFYEKIANPPPPRKGAAPETGGDGGNAADVLNGEKWMSVFREKMRLQEEWGRMRLAEIEYDQAETERYFSGEQQKQQALERSIQLLQQQMRLDDQAAAVRLRGISTGLEESERFLKQQQQAAARFQQQWGAAFRNLAQAFSTSFRNMIVGGESFGQAMRNMFASIADSALQTATKNIATMIMENAVGKDLGSAQIRKDAGEAAAGAYKAVVGIPYAGPFLAPAAAAVAYAGVLAFDSAAGGYDIPAGINPVVQTHSKEMILPEEHADTIRSMAGRRGGGRSVGLHVIPVNGTHDLIRRSDLAEAIKTLGMQFKLGTRLGGV
jgi:hypothetical protein